MRTENDSELPVLLLIEKEETMRRSIHFSLFRQGYPVIAVETEIEAREKTRKMSPFEKRIGLIIVSVRTPGAEEIEGVRSLKEELGVAVLAIAGHADREIRVALGRIGVHEVLSKPFDVNELVMKVKSLLSNAI